jgi:hypothetical protein
MTRVLAVLVAVLTPALAVLAAPIADPKPKEEPIAFLDLHAHVTVKFNENLHSDRFANNNLASLPLGKQKLGDVDFIIAEGVLQLGSANVKDKPDKIEGIKVGRTFKKLHILQATGYNAPDDTVIGKYVVHYDDKTEATIEVAYGQDVVDWWAYPDQKAPTKSKLAWEGENEASKGFDAKIHLYRTTWENPNPKKKVVSIDFLATAPDSGAAPFCVAMTADDK